MPTTLSHVTEPSPGDPRIALMFELTRAMLDIGRDWLDLQRSLMRQQQDLALRATQLLLPALPLPGPPPADKAGEFPAFALATRMMGMMLEAGTAGLRQAAAVPDEALAPAPQRPAA
jgi:hypothetical protein